METGLIHRANEPAGRLSLLSASGWNWPARWPREPKLLLLDEIAGGLTEGECGELVATIRAIHASGVSIIWIEHVLHALNSVVERLLVLDFGKVIGIGAPDDDHGLEARSGKSIWGSRSDRAAGDPETRPPVYGDFQALFGVDIALDAGETIAIIGANGAGKTTLMRSISGVLQNAPDADSPRRRSRSARCRRPTCSRAASPWCRRGASCFRR